MFKKYLFDNYYSQLLLCLYAFFLPINQKSSTIILIIILIYFIILLFFKKLKFNIKHVSIITFYFLYGTSIFYSYCCEYNIFERKASLLAFPIIFSIVDFDKIKIDVILKYFIYGCVLAVIICELKAFLNSIDFNNLSIHFSSEKNISFYDSLSKDKNFFFSYNFSFIHQTVYFGMYLCFAIGILLNSNIFKKKNEKYIIFLFLTLAVIQTLNKASFFTLFVIISFKMYSIIKNKKIALGSLIFATLLSFLIFILNPRFSSFSSSMINSISAKQDKVYETDYKKIKNIKPNRHNYRVMLWSSALDIIKDNPFIGIGAGCSDDELYKVFAVKRQWYDKSEGLNAHNQYLQVLLDLGIVGFINFSLIFYFILFKFKKINALKYRSILKIFTFIVLFNFLFETMFNRYSGISFIIFFSCLFMSLEGRNLNRLCITK